MIGKTGHEIKISVVLPIYNVEKCIPYTLESLKAQTYRDFEIVLVDDGTPDRSIEVAESILKDTDISYKLIRQENGGLGYARNTGMDNSDGEWVYFLDTDDTIHKDTLKRMLDVGQESGADLVFSDFKNIYEYNNEQEAIQEKSAIEFSKNEIRQAFLKRSAVVLAPGTLYRRAFLKENGLRFEKIPWSEDQHFVWRVLSKVEKVAYLPCELYRYFQRASSIMHAAPISKMTESYKEIKKLPEYFEDDKKLASLIVPRWVLGCLHVVASRKDKEGFEDAWDQMDGKGCMKALLRFPSLKVKVIALTGVLSKGLLFRLIQR